MCFGPLSTVRSSTQNQAAAIKVSVAFSELYKSASFRNHSSLNFSITPVSQLKQNRTCAADSLIFPLYVMFFT